jgi:hypothetical protein
MRKANSVALVLVLALGACRGGEIDPLPPEPSPTATASPSATASPTPTPAPIVLAPPNYRIAPMPISPTWEPPGASARPAILADSWLMEYKRAGAKVLELHVTYADPSSFDVHPMGDGRAVTMLGAEAREYQTGLGDSYYTLWTLTDPDGLSTIVWGGDRETVRRFASGLRRQPVPVLAPFTLALLPEGLTLYRVQSYIMEFGISSTNWDRYMVVDLMAPTELTPTSEPRQRIQVKGQPADIIIYPNEAMIVVNLADGRKLKVSIGGMPVSQSQLVQLAEGVTITDAAQAFQSM